MVSKLARSKSEPVDLVDDGDAKHSATWLTDTPRVDDCHASFDPGVKLVRWCRVRDKTSELWIVTLWTSGAVWKRSETVPWLCYGPTEARPEPALVNFRCACMRTGGLRGGHGDQPFEMVSDDFTDELPIGLAGDIVPERDRDRLCSTWHFYSPIEPPPWAYVSPWSDSEESRCSPEWNVGAWQLHERRTRVERLAAQPYEGCHTCHFYYRKPCECPPYEWPSLSKPAALTREMVLPSPPRPSKPKVVRVGGLLR